MDEASLAFFMACGVPPWRELVKTRGIVGTPLLEIHTRFKSPRPTARRRGAHQRRGMARQGVQATATSSSAATN
jgi:4-hydroxybenzoyl-CoA thioesterase